MRRRVLPWAATALLATSLVIPATGGAASEGGDSAENGGWASSAASGLCVGGHGVVYLSGFSEPTYTSSPGFQVRVPSRFYWGTEGGSSTATIRPTMGCADGGGEIGRVKAHYTTEAPPDATATPGTDYTHTADVTATLCEDQHGDDPQAVPAGCRSPVPKSAQASIPLPTDGEAETDPTLEWFQFRLTAGVPDTTQGGNGVGGVMTPDRARVFVVDVNGANRATLPPGAEAQNIEMAESSFLRLHFPVFRAGPAASGSVAFKVEGVDPHPATPGPAASGGDFLCHAVPSIGHPSDATPCDYAASPGAGTGTVNFGTSRIGWIRITVNHDTIGEEPESLRITLTEGGTLTPVEEVFTGAWIRDNDGGPSGEGGDRTPPRTRFHHPRDGKKYRYGAYQIREFHVFASKDESGVDWVQIALRRKMKSGKCAWWTGSRFRAGRCGAKRWVRAPYYRELDWYYLRLPVLRPTIGTKIRNYTAWSRARDGNFNVEKTFQKGRNLNTFQVKKRR